MVIALGVLLVCATMVVIYALVAAEERRLKRHKDEMSSVEHRSTIK